MVRSAAKLRVSNHGQGFSLARSSSTNSQRSAARMFRFFSATGRRLFLPCAKVRGAERRKAHLCHALRSARRVTLVRRDASLATPDKFTQSAQTSCEGCSPLGAPLVAFLSRRRAA